ncbi:hypothetical protein [Halorussus halobius]|uniref:hypothetical protein n=1 Tax=Halorussus halobius TaxID=1710537 RepID=UPI0010931E00|nr:hypothetical protein [Halorussus halobius]
MHNAPLPEASQPTESDTLGQQLSELGLLNDDSAEVEAISSQAADLELNGQIRWGEDISRMIASELDELADANLPALPLFRRGDTGSYPNQGWYSVSSATVDPLHGNQRSAWEYTINLTFKRRRGSGFRTLALHPRQADHPFGNDLTELAAVPASAGKVRWIDSEAGASASATPVEMRAGRTVDASLYDIADGEDALEVDAPSLVYDVSYQDDVQAGVRVYDTRGHDSKFRGEDGGGPRRWQTIHSTEHDVADPVVVSNGLLRVRLDEASTPHLHAETWDDTAGGWTSLGLDNTSDWTLYDIDLTMVGMHDLRAQLEFQHPSMGLYDLDVSLQYGRSRLLVERPESADSPVPQALVDWLDPIAADWLMDVQPSRGLVSRGEVRA